MTTKILTSLVVLIKTLISSILTNLSLKLKRTIEGAVKFYKKGTAAQHKKEVEKADEVKGAYDEIDRKSQANRDTGTAGAITRLRDLNK